MANSLRRGGGNNRASIWVWQQLLLGKRTRRKMVLPEPEVVKHGWWWAYFWKQDKLNIWKHVAKTLFLVWICSIYQMSDPIFVILFRLARLSVSPKKRINRVKPDFLTKQRLGCWLSLEALALKEGPSYLPGWSTHLLSRLIWNMQRCKKNILFAS